MDIVGTITSSAFVAWFKQRVDALKHLTIDQLVAEFQREQAIREEHKDDPTDLGRS